MATTNKAGIQTTISANIRSGNSDTTALELRAVLNEILDSYANVIDGGDVYQAPVGYNYLPVTLSAGNFINKAYADGRYALAGATSDLATILGAGNNTNDQDIVSQTSISVLSVKDAGFFATYNDGFTASGMAIDSNGVSISSDYNVTLTSNTLNFFGYNDNAVFTIQSPTGYYYPIMSFKNNGGTQLGSIMGYGGMLYLNGDSGTGLQVSSTFVMLPNATADTLTYYNSLKRLDSVTIGTGLTFSSGTLSTSFSNTTASNGLTKVTNDIRLGGTLTQNTTIDGDSLLNYSFNFINGYMGVGTSSPLSRLYVNAYNQDESVILNNDNTIGSSYFGLAQSGSIKAGMILLNSSHTYIPKTLIVRNSWDNGSIRINGGSSDTNMMYFDTTTFAVGIRNTSPTYALDIDSPNSTGFRAHSSNNSIEGVISSQNYSASLIVNAAASSAIGSIGAGVYIKEVGVTKGSFTSNSSTGLTSLSSGGGNWLLLNNSTTESIGLGQGGNYISFNMNGSQAAYIDSTNSFTARLKPRVLSITSSATPTINTDSYDAVTITNLATAITSMTTNLVGTPNNFQKLIIRIKDDGTARAITWGASFVSRGGTLPTTTVANKLTTVGLIYNASTSTWGCVAVAQEA